MSCPRPCYPQSPAHGLPCADEISMLNESHKLSGPWIRASILGKKDKIMQKSKLVVEYVFGICERNLPQTSNSKTINFQHVQLNSRIKKREKSADPPSICAISWRNSCNWTRLYITIWKERILKCMCCCLVVSLSFSTHSLGSQRSSTCDGSTANIYRLVRLCGTPKLELLMKRPCAA